MDLASAGADEEDDEGPAASGVPNKAMGGPLPSAAGTVEGSLPAGFFEAPPFTYQHLPLMLVSVGGLLRILSRADCRLEDLFKCKSNFAGSGTGESRSRSTCSGGCIYAHGGR